MARELELVGPRQVRIVPYDEAPLGEEEVRAEAILSGISHGTEMNLYRGSSPFADKEFDTDLRLFRPRTGTQAVPPLGYEWVGRVTETGARVGHLLPGDRVHLLYPHRDTQTFVPEDMPYRGRLNALPPQVTPEQAVFLALGGVALQAVHDAQIKLGDRVAIFGMGAIGLLAVQLARLDGAVWIDAIDPIPMRRELALGFGADRALDPGSGDVGYEIKSASKEHGADVAIEVSGQPSGLHEAVRCVAKAGRVVAAGFYQGGADGLRLGEEWHHNRVTMVSSMAVWDCPHRDYPLWDRARVEAVVINLMAAGKLRTDGLITHRFPFDRAAEAYALIDEHPDEVVKVVLTYE